MPSLNDLDPEKLGLKIKELKAKNPGIGTTAAADWAVQMLTTGEANGHHPQSEQAVRAAIEGERHS